MKDNKFDKLKSHIDLTSVFASAMSKYHPTITCPSHSDKNPSCHVYPNGFKCFSCGWHGDIFDFYVASGKAKDVKDAYDQVLRDHGVGLAVDWASRPPAKRAVVKKDEPYAPFPQSALRDKTHFSLNWKEGIPRDQWRKDKTKKWLSAIPDKIFLYRTAEGEVCTAVCRYGDKAPSKTAPKSWDAKSGKVVSGNRRRWHVEKLGGHPLYDLPKIIKNSTATIVVVEGEKCAAFLREAIKEEGLDSFFVVTTAIGGTNSLAYSDLTPLHGRNVILWADNDDPGRELMMAIGSVVIEKGGKCVNVPPATKEKGSDCADINPKKAVEKVQSAFARLGKKKEKEGKDVEKRERAEVFLSADVMDFPIAPKDINGLPKSCAANIQHILNLEEKKGNVRLRYNVLMQTFELVESDGITPHPLTSYAGQLQDGLTSALKIYLERVYKFPIVSEHLQTAMSSLENSPYHVYHPIRDYLNGLEWDGESRLKNWFEEAFQPPEEEREWSEIATRKFLIGAVARVMSDHDTAVDQMLIIESDQGGVGKTKGINALFGGYTTHLKRGVREDKADDVLDMAKNWAVIDDELKIMSWMGAEQMREFITKERDLVRRPYGRSSTVIRKGYVVMGTINPPGGGRYLPEKGNDLRRIWVVKSTKASMMEGEETIDYIKRNRDQLWAEAFHLWQEGNPWHLTTQEEIELHKAAVEKRRKVGYLEDELREFLSRKTDTFVVKVSQLPYLLLRVEGAKTSVTKKHQEAINNAMHGMGWEQKVRSIDGVKSRCWVKKGGW